MQYAGSFQSVRTFLLLLSPRFPPYGFSGKFTGVRASACLCVRGEGTVGGLAVGSCLSCVLFFWFFAGGGGYSVYDTEPKPCGVIVVVVSVR